MVSLARSRGDDRVALVLLPGVAAADQVAVARAGDFDVLGAAGAGNRFAGGEGGDQTTPAPRSRRRPAPGRQRLDRAVGDFPPADRAVREVAEGDALFWRSTSNLSWHRGRWPGPLRRAISFEPTESFWSLLAPDRALLDLQGTDRVLTDQRVRVRSRSGVADQDRSKIVCWMSVHRIEMEPAIRAPMAPSAAAGG